MTIQIRVHRADGKTGSYRQDDARRAEVLAQRLDPQTMFCSGPIVIGMLNPFSIINPDEVCWIEATSSLPLMQSLPQGVESARVLASRAEFEETLARQWPLWRRHAESNNAQLLEALVALSFRGGAEIFLHVLGSADNQDLRECLAASRAWTATLAPQSMLYVNPRCLVRMRVYHSKQRVNYPDGLWFAESDDI